jgi:hypothetical protein
MLSGRARRTCVGCLLCPCTQLSVLQIVTGIHKRVRDVKKQDWPLPIKVLHKVDEILELEWTNNTPQLL